MSTTAAFSATSTSTSTAGSAAPKTVLLAGWDRARTAAWRDELLALPARDALGHSPLRPPGGLSASGQWTVLAPVHSFAAARVLLHRQPPDLLVSDLRLPDGTVIDMIRVMRTGLGNGIGLGTGGAQRALPTQILVVANGQDTMLLDALQEGADNFFDRSDATGATLASHAADTLAGGADIAPWIARRLLDHFDADDSRRAASSIEEMANPLALTTAERQLLRQLSIGQRLSEVARVIGQRPREIAGRVRTIYRKMQWGLRAGDLRLQLS